MRVGCLGAGQLGRMLALAGYPLGLEFRFFDPAPGSPAGVMAEQIVSGYDDWSALARFVEGLDVVTYEFENVPVETARFLAERIPVFPPPGALEAAQDRLTEKSLCRRLGLGVPGFVAVDSAEDLDRAVAELGLPGVLKTRRMGYDGKGQEVLRTSEDLKVAGASLEGRIYEAFVPFDRELSIIAVRAASGETAFYPLVENHHREGILRLTLAPAPNLTPELQRTAESYARKILAELNYVGVLAIELFQVGDQLLVNEMAPRVHNSGHWTIDGAVTSQFENHLRAICGLPLGSCEPVGASAMVNLIGDVSRPEEVLAIPGAHLHLYGKSPRPGRKLGHVNVCASEPAGLAGPLAELERLVPA